MSGHASAAYEIVPYGPGDRDAIARLQKNLWGPEESVNRDYLAWKHETNPYRREPLIYLARYGGDVVGMRSFLPTLWEAGSPSSRFGALYADDFAIAPEHRDRGLATRIMQTAFRELRGAPYPWAINLSAGRITHLGSLAAGWKGAGTMDPLGRRSLRFAALHGLRSAGDSFPLVGPAATRLASRLSGTLEPFARFDRMRAGRLGPHITAAAAARSAEMADLVSRLPYDGRIRHVRDESYLAWRFRNPLRSYRFLYYYDDGRLEGYLVLQAGRTPIGRVHLVDWEARDEGVRADLLRAALGGGAYPELWAWASTLSASARRLLQGNGFRPRDRVKTAQGFPCVLVRPLTAEGATSEWKVGGRRLLDLADWDLRMIYSMHG